MTTPLSWTACAIAWLALPAAQRSPEAEAVVRLVVSQGDAETLGAVLERWPVGASIPSDLLAVLVHRARQASMATPDLQVPVLARLLDLHGWLAMQTLSLGDAVDLLVHGPHQALAEATVLHQVQTQLQRLPRQYDLGGLLARLPTESPSVFAQAQQAYAHVRRELQARCLAQQLPLGSLGERERL